MGLEFAFDPATHRYRYITGAGKGQFVSESAVRSLTEKSVAQVEADLVTLADLLVENKISLAAWEEQSAIALRNLHTWNFMLGIGGQKQMSDRDRAILQERINSEIKYLRGLSSKIQKEGMSEAAFRARLNMYSSAARGTYEQGQQIERGRNGWLWEKRLRTKSESCASCVWYAGMGWQPIGTLPIPASLCECRSRCGCIKIYSKNLTKPEDFMRKWGWVGADNPFMLMNIAWQKQRQKQEGEEGEGGDDSQWEPPYRMPTEEELAKINRYVPDGMRLLDADEVAVVPIMASDNLLNRSLGKWGLDGLRSLASLAIGKPVMLNHDWEDVLTTNGRIFDARVAQCTNADTIKAAIAQAGNDRWNRSVVDKEGYWCLILDAYFPIWSSAPDKIRMGTFDSVSLGAFRFDWDKVGCPICELPFSNKECPHAPPVFDDGIFFGPESENVAPYYIRPVPFDLGEVSFVTVPNLPRAGVLNATRRL